MTTVDAHIVPQLYGFTIQTDHSHTRVPSSGSADNSSFKSTTFQKHHIDQAIMSGHDKHPQGGSLSDMAVDGTTVPADSAKQRTIPSVPRPGQITDPSNDPNNYGAADLAGAADNAGDISRVRMPFSNPLDSCLLSKPS